MNRKPKKSEAITVSNFNVTTRWVSVEIYVSHIVAKMCARTEMGLLRVVSDAVRQLAVSVSIHADNLPDRKPGEIIRVMRKPLLFLGHSPGQKLVPLELQMEARQWERVKAAAAVLDVSVVEFCQEALRQRSAQIAEFHRSRSEKPGGLTAKAG